MFCKNCGKEIDDNAAVCIHCGAATEEKGNSLQYHDVPKCRKCGYIGEFEREKLFRKMDWIIGLLTIWFGFGLLYFIIVAIIRSDKNKRATVCPHCGEVGSATDVY